MREVLHKVYPILGSNDKEKWYGSAFIVDNKIKTVWHLLINNDGPITAKIVINGQEHDISHKNSYVDFTEPVYSTPLPDSAQNNDVSRIVIAQNKPKIGETIYVLGMSNPHKPFVIKGEIEFSAYSTFSVALPKESNYHGFSGGPVLNKEMEAVGVMDHQPEIGLTNVIVCQFITPDRYEK